MEPLFLCSLNKCNETVFFRFSVEKLSRAERKIKKFFKK